MRHLKDKDGPSDAGRDVPAALGDVVRSSELTDPLGGDRRAELKFLQENPASTTNIVSLRQFIRPPRAILQRLSEPNFTVDLGQPARQAVPAQIAE